MSEDACISCGRPAGAGHESECLEVQGYIAELEAHVAELEAALEGLLGIIEDPGTRTIPQVVNAIKALKG